MQLRKQLLQRNHNTHKGDFGHIFVLAGSLGLTGAAYLTSQSAIKTGAGLVTLGIAKSLNSIMEIKLTEVMTLPLAETPQGSLSLKAFDEIKDFQDRCDCWALGPGLSRNKSTAELIRKVLSFTTKPAIIDADAVNAFEGYSSFLKKCCKVGKRIFTPHPGELARLLKINTREINANRLKIAKDFASRYSVIMVLKGYKTIVTDGKTVYINNSGNPGMATAGCGDVLTGMIAAFLAQNLKPFEAAKVSVYLHGLAGDIAKKEKTELGLTASDLIDNIPKALKKQKIK